MTNVIKSTFPTDDFNGELKVHQAVHGSPLSMNDVQEGEILKVVDVLIYEDEVDQYGKVELTEITTLFTENGQLYASVSKTVGESAKSMIPFFDKVNSLNVIIVKRESKGGRTFLNLQVVGTDDTPE